MVADSGIPLNFSKLPQLPAVVLAQASEVQTHELTNLIITNMDLFINIRVCEDSILI